MATFIYTELGLGQNYAYYKPVLGEVKKRFPTLDYLDLDSYSEEFLIAQAGQVVEVADSCAVYFKSYDSEAPLGAAFPLVEVLIRRKEKTLVVLQGEHNRLERLFSNRGNLNFLKNPDELTMLNQLDYFFSEVK